ncbi:hypothetical protein [Celeribacter sp.]|uniref:hypothetical protein n=1 Tax=Celeribacter sp. TaxID=1890673 RepID=UPI003A8DBA3D
MTTMSFMTSSISTLALRAADESRPQKANIDNGFAELKGIESVSLLGEHDGIMDDYLFDLLVEEAA